MVLMPFELEEHAARKQRCRLPSCAVDRAECCGVETLPACDTLSVGTFHSTIGLRRDAFLSAATTLAEAAAKPPRLRVLRREAPT